MLPNLLRQARQKISLFIKRAKYKSGKAAIPQNQPKW